MGRSGRALDLPEYKPDFFLQDGFDLVVSANILSQLPLSPLRYASRRENRPIPRQVRAFARRLVVNHLDWLASFAGNVCLISDLERLYCEGENVVCREGSLWGVDLPQGGRGVDVGSGPAAGNRTQLRRAPPGRWLRPVSQAVLAPLAQTTTLKRARESLSKIAQCPESSHHHDSPSSRPDLLQFRLPTHRVFPMPSLQPATDLLADPFREQTQGRPHSTARTPAIAVPSPAPNSASNGNGERSANSISSGKLVRLGAGV